MSVTQLVSGFSSLLVARKNVHANCRTSLPIEYKNIFCNLKKLIFLHILNYKPSDQHFIFVFFFIYHDYFFEKLPIYKTYLYILKSNFQKQLRSSILTFGTGGEQLSTMYYCIPYCYSRIRENNMEEQLIQYLVCDSPADRSCL